MIEIKSRFNGEVIFKAVGSIKFAVEAAVSGGADLRDADLTGALSALTGYTFLWNTMRQRNTKEASMKLVKWTAIIHTLFAAAIAILLFGCAQTIMVHPTKTTAEFEHDKYDCEHRAIQYASDLGFKGNPFIIRDEMQRCLEILHGWRVQR